MSEPDDPLISDDQANGDGAPLHTSEAINGPLDLDLRSTLRSSVNVDLRSALRATVRTSEWIDDHRVLSFERVDDCHWLFVFPFPSAEGQSLFQKMLSWGSTSASEVICDAFSEIFEEGKIDGVRESITARIHAARAEVEEARASSPLMSSARLCDTSLAEAQQCTIEIFIALLQSLNTSYARILSNTNTSAEDIDEQIKTTVIPDVKRGRLYVGVHLGMLAAELMAESMYYPVQLSAEGVTSMGLRAHPEEAYAHVAYRKNIRDKCQKFKGTVNDFDAVLRHTDLIRLFHDRITDVVEFNELRRYGLFCNFIPLHYTEDLEHLKKLFTLKFIILLSSNQQPVEEIRRYFGEEIALYFLFLQELAWFVFYLSVFALLADLRLVLVLLGGFGSDNWEEIKNLPPDITHVVFSIIVTVWFRVFTLHWYQKQSQYSSSWGLNEHGESTMKESPNFRFHGDSDHSRGSDIKKLRALRKTRMIWQALGITCSVLLTSLFIFALTCLVVLELSYYTKSLLPKYHQSLIMKQLLSSGLGAFTGCQIKIMDGIWDKISNVITDLECRRTQEKFRASKRLKATIVNFVTSVSMLLFFSFVAVDHGQLSAQLGTLLSTTFFTRYIVLGSINRVVRSYLMLTVKHRLRNEEEISSIEMQSLMERYREKDFNNDFLDAILPLSMVLMFSMAQPGSVFFLLLSVVVQFSSDAWKLTRTYQRPYPQLRHCIGFFNDFFELLGRIVIFTQVGLLYRLYHRYSENEFVQQHKIAIVLSFGIAVNYLWSFFGWLIPMESSFTREQRQHQAVQRKTLRYLHTRFLGWLMPTETSSASKETSSTNKETHHEVLRRLSTASMCAFNSKVAAEDLCTKSTDFSQAPRPKMHNMSQLSPRFFGS